MESSLYFYNATVQDVYDGDTCTVDIDLGMSTWLRGEKIRLARINTAELRGSDRANGLKARDFLREQINGKSIYLQTQKDKKEKYGRYLGEIWLAAGNGTYINVNDLMVTKGYAVPYMDNHKPLVEPVDM